MTSHDAYLTRAAERRVDIPCLHCGTPTMPDDLNDTVEGPVCYRCLPHVVDLSDDDIHDTPATRGDQP